MTEIEIKAKVLEVLENQGVPVLPGDLYSKLEKMDIQEFDSRRAVVNLAVEHKITITPDRRVVLR